MYQLADKLGFGKELVKNYKMQKVKGMDEPFSDEEMAEVRRKKRFYDIRGANAGNPKLLTQFNADTHEFFLWDDPERPGRAWTMTLSVDD